MCQRQFLKLAVESAIESILHTRQLTAHIFGQFSHLIAHYQKSELAHLIAHSLVMGQALKR